MRRKRAESDGEDRVLRAAIYVTAGLLLVGVFFLVVRIINPRADGTEGREMLENLENGDEMAVREEIETLLAKEEADLQAWENRPLEEKLKGAVYLGDFTLQPFLDYGFISPDNGVVLPNLLVVEGAREGVGEVIAKAREKKTKKIFIFLGMNDAAVGSAGEEEVRKGFAALIDMCRQEIPEAEIYINSLEKGQISFAQVEKGQFDRYNAMIREVCEEKEAKYIDNNENAPEEEQRAFYERWGLRLVEAGKL